MTIIEQRNIKQILAISQNVIPCKNDGIQVSNSSMTLPISTLKKDLPSNQPGRFGNISCFASFFLSLRSAGSPLNCIAADDR